MQEMFDPSATPDLIAGLSSPDDAAVWKLDEERALVLTTDFFTPVVDDPYDYGRIAAANSVSDIYAMGGIPFLALNIAAIPADLDDGISRLIFLGGAVIAREAGMVIAGGHSIQDKEPKYGMVVAGMVDPRRMFTKKGAQPGDQLYMTKPLGFGTITTALKQQRVHQKDLAAAVDWMVRLNRDGSLAGSKCGVRSATDITGYSFFGHAVEMANASHVAFRFSFERIPILENAFPYAAQFIFPGGAYDNRAFFQHKVRIERALSEDQQMLLYDPQTSGGLLLAVPADRCADFESSMAERNAPAWRVGEVIQGEGIVLV